MGDAMQWKLTQIILNSSEEYPAYPMIPVEWWEVVNEGLEYTIWDNVMNITIPILHEALLDQSFNMIAWLASKLWDTQESQENALNEGWSELLCEQWQCLISDIWGHAAASLLNEL